MGIRTDETQVEIPKPRAKALSARNRRDLNFISSETSTRNTDLSKISSRNNVLSKISTGNTVSTRNTALSQQFDANTTFSESESRGSIRGADYKKFVIGLYT